MMDSGNSPFNKVPRTLERGEGGRESAVGGCGA